MSANDGVNKVTNCQSQKFIHEQNYLNCDNCQPIHGMHVVRANKHFHHEVLLSKCHLYNAKKIVSK